MTNIQTRKTPTENYHDMLRAVTLSPAVRRTIETYVNALEQERDNAITLSETLLVDGRPERVAELEAQLAAAEEDAADFHRLWLAGGKRRYELEARLAASRAEWDAVLNLIERLACGGTTYDRDGLSPTCSHCGGTGNTASANSVNHHPHCPLLEARKWTPTPRPPLTFAILEESGHED